jgi:asparagine synthase (glutamine-hydrolysing)
MCGILGHVFRRPAVREPLSGRVLSRIAHRGPDGSGVFTDAHVQLGHTRLSIIDLSAAGSQPMLSTDGRYVVTYNGEIYNHLELRAELEALGERFISHSDTEVVLVAYKIWGRACVKRFRGMFAFCLWDAATKTAFLARDRCGEKPLFYVREADRLSFASELKALVPLLATCPALDAKIVDMYLHYQYVPEPHTLLRGVHKLPAAHTLVVGVDDWSAEPVRYWSVEDTGSLEVPRAPCDILAAVRAGIEDAVKMTLRSDVPVGVALSGGIDSGIIATFAQKHSAEPMHAFCVGYPGRPAYDERAQARELAEALGMIVNEVELPVADFVDFFPTLVRIMDEPIGDPAAFGHYSVPKAAADRGIKVLLSGIGGDELFWGYSWVNQAAAVNQMLSKQPSLAALARWATHPKVRGFLSRAAQADALPEPVRHWACLVHDLSLTAGPTDQLRFYMGAPEFRDALVLKGAVIGPALADLHPHNAFTPTAIGPRGHDAVPAAIIRLLFDTWLVSNCLTLGDRVSMAVGVETRLPFLDVRLIELVMALRAQTPDHRMGQKAWLRAALTGVLPDAVLARPKAGFRPPVGEWLSGVVARYGSALRDGRLAAEGLVDRKKLSHLLDVTSRQDWGGLFIAYKLVLLELWIGEIATNTVALDMAS